MVKTSKKTAHGPITIAVRTAVLQSEQSLYELARGAGVSWPAVNRLMQPGGTMSGRNLDKIAIYLGLRIVVEWPQGR